MPHTGGFKSIATLMDEHTANGREPTRAEIFLLTHKQRVDGRPLDDDSAKAIDMINEKRSNSEGSTYQLPHRFAFQGDVYSQVLGNGRSGYVCGLGLGPTPSALWASRSFLGNILEEDSSNEIVQRLHYYPSHLKFTENTGDPKNTGLRKIGAHAEFATSCPGHRGAHYDILVYLVFLTCQCKMLTANVLFKLFYLLRLVMPFDYRFWSIISRHRSDLCLLFNVKTLPIPCLISLLNGYKVKVSNMGSLTLFPGLALYNVFFHLKDLLRPLINLLPPLVSL
ncbi:hypothetical protein KY290_001161 [Solanum tuberosum]|uniref:Uncharacterized protein n=1 Tax=Solanum tuberosum TaxID=4113 RepID=A0ABQ7WLH2_SOLTU|nr:hypothetical protein KY290_001161 [Solanum tuberosum]